MSQERWDVVLRFQDGPLAFQGDIVRRGPVVRMGANPGPGGLMLEGYRGLDERQAVITAYDGGTVAIAPVGPSQVRVAPHENVDWEEVACIQGPVYLNPGMAFHLGPAGRGVSGVFVECRRLGVWSQHGLVSEAAQVDPELQASDVRQLDAGAGRPVWFIPAIVMLGVGIAVAVTVPIVKEYTRKIAELGPVDQGLEYYDFVEATAPVDPKLLEGLNQPFRDFVMALNGAAAGRKDLADQPSKWDQTFLNYVTRSSELHLKAWAFWERLEQINDDYAYVVQELRSQKLPEVWAGIPYQESRYNGSAQSYVCAKGYWQFLPDVGGRVGIKVANCKLRGSGDTLYTPTRLIPVIGVMKNAVYVENNGGDVKCRIQSCQTDERTDLQISTRGALTMLEEAYQDEELRASGAVVQLAILTHNAGYDNSRFEEKRVNAVNILPAYRRYLREQKVTSAPDFYGNNITCRNKEDKTDDRCGGYLWKQTQHYAYNIVAQHFMAVCYYAKNYGTLPAYSPWRQYVIGEGYCNNFQVPDAESVKARGGARGGSR